jgi:hypothetical protein
MQANCTRHLHVFDPTAGGPFRSRHCGESRNPFLRRRGNRQDGRRLSSGRRPIVGKLRAHQIQTIATTSPTPPNNPIRIKIYPIRAIRNQFLRDSGYDAAGSRPGLPPDPRQSRRRSSDGDSVSGIVEPGVPAPADVDSYRLGEIIASNGLCHASRHSGESRNPSIHGLGGRDMDTGFRRYDDNLFGAVAHSWKRWHRGALDSSVRPLGAGRRQEAAACPAGSRSCVRMMRTASVRLRACSFW